MIDLAAAADFVEVPEGCVPTYGIVIVTYLDEDGGQEFMWQHLNEVPFSASIGVLTMATHLLMHEAEG